MVFKFCLFIYAFLGGVWLWEHGFNHAYMIAIGLVLAVGIVAVKSGAFWLIVFFFVWPWGKKNH